MLTMFLIASVFLLASAVPMLEAENEVKLNYHSSQLGFLIKAREYCM